MLKAWHNAIDEFKEAIEMGQPHPQTPWCEGTSCQNDTVSRERIERCPIKSLLPHHYVGTEACRCKVDWRQLMTGATVWAPVGIGWSPAVVVRLGKQRENKTVVHLTISGRTGHRSGRRYVRQLYWRNADRNGKDKPRI